jgi:hypothetical protein
MSSATAEGFPPSMISVPLPAMFVAIVTALLLPAWTYNFSFLFKAVIDLLKADYP